MSNFIRIPSISSTVFDSSEIESLTLSYLNENKGHLDNASSLLGIIESQNLDGHEKIKEIQDMLDIFDEEDSLCFFNEQNLARYVLETLSNTSMGFSDISKILLNSFPIFDIIDSDSEIMEDRIERRTSRIMNEVYPLYCSPSPEAIRHFIDVCPDVAFMEVGGDNYFAYLTSCGRLMSAQIAYAYMYIDGCVPSNIADKGTDFSSLNPIAFKAMNDFFAK